MKPCMTATPYFEECVKSINSICVALDFLQQPLDGSALSAVVRDEEPFLSSTALRVTFLTSLITCSRGGGCVRDWRLVFRT